MKSKLRICLCDFFHNYIGMGTYTFPLNIGFIAAYANHFFAEDIEISLFKFPNDFLHHIQTTSPDVVGFSHYTWNAELNLKISNKVKQAFPHAAIIFGGPNLDYSPEGFTRFFNKYRNTDFYVPFQGETPFRDIIGKIMDAPSLSHVKRGSIPGVLFRRENEEGIVEGEWLPRIRHPDEIPSPYLTGLLDRFFDMKLIPIMETNRGCPYTCTYCAQGFSSHNTMEFFSTERVKEEARYIASRVSYTNLLMVADSNFGIHRRDRELAEFFRELREKTNYPRKFHFNWAKKQPKIFELGRILQDSSYLIISLQSLDPVALKNIRRVNVDLDIFRKNIDAVNKAGGVSTTEIILGLPGETKESHLASLRQLLDWDVSFIVPYNLILLEGTEMSLRQREKFQLQTKFRMSDGCFGIYGDEYVFDVEEGVIGTSTMSQDELLWFRKLHWLLWFMWNQRMYYEILKLFKTAGVNPLDFILALRDKLEQNGGEPRHVSDAFDADTYAEWFDSPQALENHFTSGDNFTRLNNGELAGKINLKYQWRVLLECHAQFTELVLNTAIERNSILGLGLPEDAIREVMEFEHASVLDFRLEPHQLGGDHHRRFHYDILAWRNDAYDKPLINYAKPEGISYHFYLPKLQKDALKVIISQYSHQNKLATYRKMGDYMSFTDLFYAIEPDDAATRQS